MPKITFIGAGSTVFTRHLLSDLFSYPELSGLIISLHDIDATRLETSRIVAEKLAATAGIETCIEATTDRLTALKGANYVICLFQVGGYKPSTVIDFEIPQKYGLRQTIADTLGIGGIMRALRTIPVFLDICNDMAAVCPNALLLNYVNPMAMNCWAITKATGIRTIGLCHSVQNTAERLAQDIGVPIDAVNFVCAGINHMAFYLRFEQDGTSLYPAVHELVKEGLIPDDNRVRYDLFKRLGYFMTESSEHFAEYVPWYIKSAQPELIEQYNIPLDEYIRRCEVQIAEWESMRTRLEDPNQQLELQPSNEFAPQIIHSLETGTPRIIYGNVPNTGLIDNLPADCCVEVPCVVDKNGVQPLKIGTLPPHLAALIQTNINVQSLTVEAALTGKREHIYHAAMMDPHTAAELNLDQIWSLVDDLIAAHGPMLPTYH